MNQQKRPLAFIALAFALLLVFLLSAACGPRQVELTGSMFIVTRGGDNVKLGLVAVTAIAEEEALVFMKAKLEEGSKEQEGVKGTLAQLESEHEELKAASDRAREESNRAYERAMANIGTSGLSRAWHEASDRAIEASDAYFEKHFELERFRTAYSHWTSGGFYFEGLPEGVASTKTNADGEFSLTLQGGRKYALAASASRQIMDTTEYYHWLVWVDLGAEPKSVMLSNDNLITSGAGSSLVTATR